MNQRAEPEGDPIEVEAEVVRPRRSGRRWLILAIGAIAALAAAALALNWSAVEQRWLAGGFRAAPLDTVAFVPAPAPAAVTDPSQRPAPPEARPAVVTEANRPPPATSEGAALMMVADRLSTLDKRIALIEERITKPAPPDPALVARIKALEQEIAAIGEERAARLGRQVGLALAVGQLRDAVNRGRPFAAEFQALEKIGENDSSALTALRPLAERGVATVADLNARFRAVARAVARAGAGDPDPPWWKRAWQRVTDLVSIRRVGVVTGAEADAVAARAEVRMAAGDVAGALAELAALSGGALLAAEAWSEDASQHVAAMEAIEALDRAAIGRLVEERKPK